MWPFSKRQATDDKPESGLRPRSRHPMRKIIVGFIIGGAITSIIGKALLKERRKEHLGEDKAE